MLKIVHLYVNNLTEAWEIALKKYTWFERGHCRKFLLYPESGRNQGKMEYNF